MKYQENPYAKTSKYLKVKEGQTRLRLFDNISGWEYWKDEDGKRVPVRSRDLSEVPVEQRAKAKFFVAYVIWNYDADTTQVAEFTQRSIIDPLSVYFHDPDWGGGVSLKTFDIVIERKGSSLEDTEYFVTPKPKSSFNKNLEKVNLSALFDGEDPFESVEASDSDLDELVKAVDETQL